MEEKFICKYCGKVHDGSFGSGEFCNSSCASRYSSSHPITLEALESGEYKVKATSKVTRFLLKNGLKENRCEICGITE